MKKARRIALVFVIITIVLMFFIKGKIVYEKFDSHVWKTANLNSESNMTLRWDMMNDLRNKYKLIGMTKNEIINLLGNPESESEFYSEFRYYLGYTKRGINTGTLIITFDNNNIVNDIRVWQG